jgi:hypothetical protein
VSIVPFMVPLLPSTGNPPLGAWPWNDMINGEGVLQCQSSDVSLLDRVSATLSNRKL